MTRPFAVAALSLLVTAGVPSAAGAEPITPASLTPCPFTREEIAAALGIDVEQGEAADMKFPGGRDVACLYPVKGSQTVVTVRQIFDPAAQGSSNAKAPSLEAGYHAIPGDPDQAAVKSGRPEERVAELTYARGKVRTRIFVHGITLDREAVQPKLLRLRRVP